jgi:hypothetical protein
MHLDALQTTPPPPPSFEGQTSMTLGMLIDEKKLVLEPHSATIEAPWHD